MKVSGLGLRFWRIPTCPVDSLSIFVKLLIAVTQARISTKTSPATAVDAGRLSWSFPLAVTVLEAVVLRGYNAPIRVRLHLLLLATTRGREGHSL